MLPNLLATKWGRLTAFFFLYVTEGIPLGFTATAIATQMRRQGVTPMQIGAFVATLYLPWAWKWAIGPVVDISSARRHGARRAWIVVAQCLMALTLLAGMPIDFAQQLQLFTALIIVHNICGAAQDVAIDSLACNVLHDDERGLANGLMFGGAYLGQTIGGAGVLYLTDYLAPAVGSEQALQLTFPFVTACILMVTVCVALPLQEPPSSSAMPSALSDDGRSALSRIGEELRTYVITAVKSFFGSRAALAGAVFAVLPAGSYALSSALQSNLAVELGLTDKQIAKLALWSTVLSAGGCVVGGIISDRLGRRRMLAVYIILTALPGAWLGCEMQRRGWIMPIDPRAPDRPLPPAILVSIFWTATLSFAVVHGLSYGTRIALYRDITTPAVAATQFTAYMSIFNLVIAYTAGWQGWSIDHWGYPTTLFLDATVGLIGLALLPFMRRNV
jgi:PAT family beta-lactamase induction signal transducer AmpG